MHGVPREKQWRDIRYLTRLTSHWGASDSSHCWCIQFPGVNTFYWQGRAYTGAAPTVWGACGSPPPVAIGAIQCAGVRSQWGTPAHSVTSHWWGHIWGWLFILLSSRFPSPHCPSPRSLVSCTTSRQVLSQLCFREQPSGRGSSEALDA